MVMTPAQNSTSPRTPAATIDVMWVSSFGHSSLRNPQIGWSAGFSAPGQSIRTDAFMILYSCSNKYKQRVSTLLRERNAQSKKISIEVCFARCNVGFSVDGNINKRRLTHWKSLSLQKMSNGDHKKIAQHTVSDSKRIFFQRQYGKITLRVTVAVDFYRSTRYT